MAAGHVGTSHVPPATNGVPPAPVAEHDDLEGSRELSLIRVFAARRRPGDKRLSAHGNGTPVNGPAAAPPSSVQEAEPKTKGKTKRNKNKSKNIGRRLGRLFSCVSAPREAEADDDGPAGPSQRSGGVEFVREVEVEIGGSKSVDELATTLIELADNSFIPPDIESDAEDGEIDKLVGLLLRQCGDKVAEDHDCAKIFQELLSSYSTFGNLMSTVFRKIGLPTTDPGDRGPKDSDDIKANIAVTCEVASRLSAMDTHPMSRALGFGARYLKEHYPLEETLNADKDSDSDQDVE